MGISLNVDTNNENEFNQQLQLYLAQGYTMQSNLNGTAILKKKSINMGVLIVLIILFFPAAIIYYLVASDDIVTIKNNNASSGNINSNKSFDLYCDDCGQGLSEGFKFCTNCGKDLSEINQTEILCQNCGTQLSEENKFCPNCGESVSREGEL